MSYWKHLFVDGEYARRERILSGLTLDDVTRRVGEGSHSIYEELYHTVRCQRLEVPDGGDLYPAKAPVREEEWTDLVAEFLAGLDKIMEVASSPEKLEEEFQPGETWGDLLHSIAVHNAYHLGKIVAIRQAIGAWPPRESE